MSSEACQYGKSILGRWASLCKGLRKICFAHLRNRKDGVAAAQHRHQGGGEDVREGTGAAGPEGLPQGLNHKEVELGVGRNCECYDCITSRPLLS